MVKDRLTDNEIEHYHSKIVVRSLHDEKKGEMIWTVCCKKCGGVMFPYVKNMEKELVDKNLSEHTCIKIIGLKKNGS